MTDDVTDNSNPFHPGDPVEPAHPAAADGDAPTGETRRDELPQTGGEAPLEPPPEEVEGATPPGYDWPTHGGYLGCLVGTLGACPIVGFIGANLWALFHLSQLAFPLFVLLMLGSLVAVVAAGRLGWALGRRFYRYYPQPRPTWGENDEAAAAIEAESAAAAEARREGRQEGRPFIP